MVYIYCLKLKQNKYYLGKSKKPYKRINQHFKGKGSAWTKKYSPIEIAWIESDCDDHDEEKFTIMMMEEYGIDNVRGGCFSKIKLAPEEVKVIELMIKGSGDKCFNCGSDQHFLKQCPDNQPFEDDSCDSCGSWSDSSYGESWSELTDRRSVDSDYFQPNEPCSIM